MYNKSPLPPAKLRCLKPSEKLITLTAAATAAVWTGTGSHVIASVVGGGVALH